MEQPTAGDLLSQARSRLKKGGVPSPYAEALILLEHVTATDRARLLAFPETSVSVAQAEQFMELVDRRCRREPLSYITGYREFMGLSLRVGPGVLVPRPETELMVELAAWGMCHGGHEAAGSYGETHDGADVVTERKDLSSAHSVCSMFTLPKGAVAVDVGTGSGAIALALKHIRPDITVIATDVSPDALAWAERNRAELGLDVDFRQGDLLQPVEGPVDAVLSNPPYVALGDPVDPETAFEPSNALYAGNDGLEIIRKLVPQAAAVLREGGVLFMELDPAQMESVKGLLAESGFGRIVTVKDLSGKNRIIAACYGRKF